MTAHWFGLVRLSKDKVDVIFDALPFGRLWYGKPDDAVEYAKFFSRSPDAGLAFTIWRPT
jgi:hypothetical protein